MSEEAEKGDSFAVRSSLRQWICALQIGSFAILGEAIFLLGVSTPDRWSGLSIRLGFFACVVSGLCALGLICDAKGRRRSIGAVLAVFAAVAAMLAIRLITAHGPEAEKQVALLLKAAADCAGVFAVLCTGVELAARHLLVEITPSLRD